MPKVSDRRLLRLIQKHKELIRVSKLILSVLGDSESPVGHTALQKGVSTEWYEQEREAGREGEEMRHISCFNQAIGKLVDERLVIRQTLGRGMKYKLKDRSDA